MIQSDPWKKGADYFKVPYKAWNKLDDEQKTTLIENAQKSTKFLALASRNAYYGGNMDYKTIADTIDSFKKLLGRYFNVKK